MTGPLAGIKLVEFVIYSCKRYGEKSIVIVYHSYILRCIGRNLSYIHDLQVHPNVFKLETGFQIISK